MKDNKVILKFSFWIKNRSSSQVVILGLVLFLFFTAVILPRQSANTKEYAGEMGSIDLKFFYTAEEVNQMASAYGEDGRAAYIQARWTYDLAWPIVYAFFLSTSISYIFARGFFVGSKWHIGNLIPIGGMVIDYLENIAITYVMLKHPVQLNWLANMTAIFTSVKWILISVGFGLLFMGLIRWGIILRRRQMLN